jgi:hypothetical protein
MYTKAVEELNLPVSILNNMFEKENGSRQSENAAAYRPV